MEEKKKCDEPLSVQSTDLGEEIQTNNIFSIQPPPTIATFSTQETVLKDLHQSLNCWEHVIKVCSFKI